MVCLSGFNATYIYTLPYVYGEGSGDYAGIISGIIGLHAH